MKLIILILLAPLFIVSCTTMGSRDAAKLKPHHANYVAEAMTRELVSFPRPIITPKGRPVFDAFNAEFAGKGWDIHPYEYKQFGGTKRQQKYIRIYTDYIGRDILLVQLRSPFFDVHQSFFIQETGDIYETSIPTLHLKDYEQ